ncbi:uncharacterized protein CLUP02_01556 [Colletotrichum lupini]|uniref:Uncharacterized protein n=1 Tax=Colletotrichum lupini TaxID=145971 RepID=A0A9Q8W9A2_9PEZI|nr:uncharacterized protein CLUP02_01556 [Colletotrichum lupini]UQC74904.1 hypothetical protein CLUP02_01556 [Colletotrichum lupini]
MSLNCVSVLSSTDHFHSHSHSHFHFHIRSFMANSGPNTCPLTEVKHHPSDHLPPQLPRARCSLQRMKSFGHFEPQKQLDAAETFVFLRSQVSLGHLDSAALPRNTAKRQKRCLGFCQIGYEKAILVFAMQRCPKLNSQSVQSFYIPGAGDNPITDYYRTARNKYPGRQRAPLSEEQDLRTEDRELHCLSWSSHPLSFSTSSDLSPTIPSVIKREERNKASPTKPAIFQRIPLRAGTPTLNNTTKTNSHVQQLEDQEMQFLHEESSESTFSMPGKTVLKLPFGNLRRNGISQPVISVRFPSFRCKLSQLLDLVSRPIQTVVPPNGQCHALLKPSLCGSKPNGPTATLCTKYAPSARQATRNQDRRRFASSRHEEKYQRQNNTASNTKTAAEQRFSLTALAYLLSLRC